MPKWQLVVIAVGAFVAAIGFLWSWQHRDGIERDLKPDNVRKSDRYDVGDLLAPRAISSQEIEDEYLGNEVRADHELGGMTLEIHGVVGKVAREKGRVVVVFPTRVRWIAAYMAPEHGEDADRIAAGREGRLRCRGAGLRMHIPVLEDCRVL